MSMIAVSKDDKYNIVWEDSFAKLVDSMNDIMKDGWKPSGNVNVMELQMGHPVYVQAVTR